MPESPLIAIVAFDGVQPLDVSGPWEVLSTAGLIADRPANLRLLTPGGRSVRGESGLRFEADGDVHTADGVDTLIVAGGVGTRDLVRDERLTTSIRRLAGGARRTAGVCTGAFLLAEAGLLDGRRATTHWFSCEALARHYPAVTVEHDPIFIRDGDVFTSAGVTAGMDLALALAEEDLGREVALQTARTLVIYARRPGGQSQFSVQLAHQSAERAPLRELQAWIAEHPEADLSVAALASRMHLSERQLGRVFRRELGATPADYVEQVRVERARTLLETLDAQEGTLERVARSCGFASAEVMRRAFRRRLGTNPSQYRERFRSPLAA
jgi:transcriptional regulator GlxA family with amidase domain